jgi:TRAP-type mannitol/chloroaromatic compound transport system permease small subunit
MSQPAADEQARSPGWRNVVKVFLIAVFFYPCLLFLWFRMVSSLVRSIWHRGFASPPEWGAFRFCYWFVIFVIYTLATLIVFALMMITVMSLIER